MLAVNKLYNKDLIIKTMPILENQQEKPNRF
jgi:hypothetical protein